jgi:hypothetical protein
VSSVEVIWLAVTIWGLVNCAIFAIGYQAKTHGTWRHYPMGRHLMGFIVVLGIAFTLIAASLVIGPLGPWPWITALALVNLLLTQRNWLLFTRKWRSSAGAPSEETVETKRRK